MNATRTIISACAAVALASGALAVSAPATASTKASGKATYALTEFAMEELKPAGIKIAFGRGGKGLSITQMSLVYNESLDIDIVRAKLSGEVVFSRGNARFSASGFQAEWYDTQQFDEDFGVLNSPGRMSLNLNPNDRKVKVKVDKAKKTRTTTRTVKAAIYLSTEPEFATTLNRALKTQAFWPGMPLGQVTFVVVTKAACKNSACTK